MKITTVTTVTITYDGSETEYIELGDHLDRQMHLMTGGLDSLDAGDATGAIRDWVLSQYQEGAFPIMTAYKGRTLTAAVDELPFSYEGEWGRA